MAKTTYVILIRQDPAFGYKQVGEIEASGARTALRKWFLGKENEIGPECSAAAVPASSWNPEPIEAETQTRLKIG